VTLKSQCYFDILGYLSGPSCEDTLLAILELRIHRRRWKSATNPFVLIGTVNTVPRSLERLRYGVPVNQLSLIYLVKEHWFAKNQKRVPDRQGQAILLTSRYCNTR
jgi:hypothetical protein